MQVLIRRNYIKRLFLSVQFFYWNGRKGVYKNLHPCQSSCKSFLVIAFLLALSLCLCWVSLVPFWFSSLFFFRTVFSYFLFRTTSGKQGGNYCWRGLKVLFYLLHIYLSASFFLQYQIDVLSAKYFLFFLTSAITITVITFVKNEKNKSA